MSKKEYTVVNPAGHESRALTFKRAAAYAAKIIKSEIERKPPRYPHLLICHAGSAVVETVGHNHNYRARIADADIDDAVAGTATRDKHRYILTACQNTINDAKRGR